MNKLLITGCLLATAFAAVAMPNKKELAAAQKLVEDVIAPDVKALNAGRKTVKDVADVQMKLAADAQSEAEKYLLLQSAFKLYSRGEEFNSAAKALTAITRDIKDVPPELITELVDKEFNRDMDLRAPKEIVAAERAAQRQRLVATQKEKEKTRKIRPTLGGLRRSDQLGARRLQRQQEAQTATQLQATVDGYTWSYRVNNGEATISSVSPKPMGDVSVPSTLGGVNVTSIGRWAFSHCDRMKSLIIPEGMTSIGLGAFTGCSQLASLALPQSLKSIEDYAFFRCGKLTAVMIPKGLTTAGDGVFAGCSELVEINVEEGSQCFMSVDGVLYSKDQTELVMCPVGIASVTVPSHVRKIRLGAFLGFGKLMQIHVEADNPMYSSVDGMLCTKDKTSLLACPGGRTSVTIPMGVVHISRCAFWWGEGLVSVTIPQSVSDVGTRAFAVCKGLVSIAIPSSVTSIGDLAFEGCDGLTSVTMCGEKPNFQGKVFSNCKNLKFIHVPAKAKSWAGMTEWQGIPLAFDDDTDVVTQGQATVDGYTWSYRVTNGEAMIVSPTGKLYERAVSPCPTGDLLVPSSIDGVPVTGIGKFALCGSRELTSVKIPKTVTSIGEWAFDKCDKLTAVTIPSSVTYVGGAVFADCPELQKIGLEASNPRYKTVDGVLYTKDMKRLVVGPGGKVSHTIPAGVTDIANDAFRCCRMLSSVAIPSGVTRIGDSAFCGTALKSVVIPTSVKKIERFAFFICSRMTSLILSEGVESIGEFAFHGDSGLTSVEIPASVKGVGKEAFSNCSNLTSVTMRGEKPDSGDKVFAKCDKLKSIHVPANAKSWAGMTEWQGIPLVFDGQ